MQSSFVDNIRDADLADMKIKSECKKEFVFHYVFLILPVNPHGLFL